MPDPGPDGPPAASLFVVGLPRSLSTLVVLRAGAALGLAEPSWAGAAELLNLDRNRLHGGPGYDESRKFAHPELDPEVVDAAEALLDDAVRPSDRIYKDVVQPFAVARWLATHPTNTLVLERPLADVAFAMLASRWYYPATASWLARDRKAAVLEGLVRAEQALAGIAGVRLRFDDLIDDEDVLWRALAELYPDADLDTISYRDGVFVTETRRQRARRVIPAYRALCCQLDQVRAEVDQGGPPSVRPEPEPPVSPSVAESIRRLACELIDRRATVGVIDHGVVVLEHLEGRRTQRLPGPDQSLTDSLGDLDRDGIDHLLVLRPDLLSADEQDRLDRAVARARPLHRDPMFHLYGLSG